MRDVVVRAEARAAAAELEAGRGRPTSDAGPRCGIWHPLACAASGRRRRSSRWCSSALSVTPFAWVPYRYRRRPYRFTGTPSKVYRYERCSGISRTGTKNIDLHDYLRIVFFLRWFSIDCFKLVKIITP